MIKVVCVYIRTRLPDTDYVTPVYYLMLFEKCVLNKAIIYPQYRRITPLRVYPVGCQSRLHVETANSVLNERGCLRYTP